MLVFLNAPFCLAPRSPLASTDFSSPLFPPHVVHKETLPNLDLPECSGETAAGRECQRGVENRLRLSGHSV